MSAAVIARNLFRSFQEARHKKNLLAQVRSFQGFVPVAYENEQFRVETARTPNQLLKILELRHEVFVEEWQGRRAFHGLDVDQYDFNADHLMITDKNIGEVVGTYRLLSSHFTRDFYSASEFEMSGFLRTPAVKLELGRACVHAEYRNGQAIEMLWKGLTRYIAQTKTEFLFGCSSVKSMRADVIDQIVDLLRGNDQWSDDYTIRPTADYRFPHHAVAATVAGLNTIERRQLLPPLLRSYLAAGAKVHGAPALDLDFGCTDMFTILDWKSVNPKYLKRFA